MTLPETISADYTLRPNELADVLALLVETRQPTMVWGSPGAAKSMIARQVWSLDDLPIVLGRSYPETCEEPLRPLADAERRVTELACVHLVEPGAENGP